MLPGEGDPDALGAAVGAPGPGRLRPRLLFLAHRCPYPPDKGEKIRAWHMLDHLAERWDVDLGCLLDDPADIVHVPHLRTRCAAVAAYPVARYAQMARALLRSRPGAPLTLGWFYDARLAGWVQQGLAERRWDAALIFSSAMAPYVMGPAAARAGLRRVLDMVDIDSEKWLAYAATARPPMRQIWARESRTLLALERQAAQELELSVFVSEAEAHRFAELAPESAARIDHVDNGVDLVRFDPAQPWPSPFGSAPALVFTGTMGYRPNIEAVCWFADEVLPRLRSRNPAPEFWVVGANPAPAVQALSARPGIRVTGTVPDVRPYLAHAAAAVAPLRIARGVQNKVLEAMAMERPVIATPQAFEGIRARAGGDLLVAADAAEFAARVDEVLDGRHGRLGRAARLAVAAGHDWTVALRRLDGMLRVEVPEPLGAAA